MNKEEIKKEFIEIFNKNIQREGKDKLLEWIKSTDFFDTPASTKHHSVFEGGLCQHSINVYKRFKRLLVMEFGDSWQEKISDESATIIALMHDICKANTYKVEFRNVKNDMGVWEKKPYYAFFDTLPYGHGEKSVYIISGFMRLTRDEAMAINWHMGAYDLRAQSNSSILTQVFRQFPLAFIFHLADYQATYLDESELK